MKKILLLLVLFVLSFSVNAQKIYHSYFRIIGIDTTKAVDGNDYQLNQGQNGNFLIKLFTDNYLEIITSNDTVTMKLTYVKSIYKNIDRFHEVRRIYQGISVVGDHHFAVGFLYSIKPKKLEDITYIDGNIIYKYSITYDDPIK